MKVYDLRCEMKIPLPIREVFAVFENPYNLAKITPPWLGFNVLTENVKMRKDAEIEYRIFWMKLPMRWKTVITAYNPPNNFIDYQVKGPYPLWEHLHTFVEENGVTHVRDHVQYALPLGPLGAIAHELLVRKQLTGIFEYRQQALREIWGCGETSPVTIQSQRR